jgi:SNF2 family DNA or RNA helicase
VRELVHRPYGHLALDFIGQRERSALWAKPGMGKTLIGLTYLDILHNVLGEDGQTLVLAPLRVARDTWVNEAKKWSQLSGLEVVSATGIAAARTAALRKDVQVVCTNYDNLVWLREWYADNKKAWPFTTIVADEATKLKSFRLRQGGVRAQALGQVAHKDVKRFIELTGTPSSNGLEDLWGQIWFLDAGQRLGRTFSAFQSRWFRPVKAGQFNRWVQADHAQDEIQERLKDLCLTLDPKDWFDLAEPIVNVIEVELPPSARVHYKALEKEMFTQLADGREVEVFNAAALTNKCLQCANGAVYLDSDRYGPDVAVEVHEAKIEAVESLLGEQGGEPLLLAYHFKSDLARLQKAFPHALNLSTEDGMAAAMRGEGTLWLGHPASMGHGVDGLQHHCNTVVFFAQDWSLENHDQLIERVGPMRQYQAGKTRNVHVHYIVARDTVDELVMARRGSKRSVQDALMDYMKTKK